MLAASVRTRDDVRGMDPVTMGRPMTSLFISHSSADRELAHEIATRLTAVGYGALFLDTDLEQGIPVGSRWERELYAALRRSDALIFVGTEAAANSRWCFAELVLARSVGTPIFAIRAGRGPSIDLLDDVQWVDLSDREQGYARLLEGLRRRGLDPGNSFSWDGTRSPYPGLKAFSAADAAVFFGRTSEVERLAQLLHPSFARGAGRWVGIIGPSGSGKSSLLHAGLLPGVTRMSEEWIVVPPFVPGVRPTRHLAASLAQALATSGRPQDPLHLEHRMSADDAGTAALADIIQELSEAGNQAPKKVLVSIDQAEELVTRTGRVEQQSFLRLIRGALVEDSPLWVACTLRSEFLSTDPDRAGLTEVIDDTLVVEPLSRNRLSDIITQPARRAGLQFDPGLVERMVEETTGGDALPLLAYTLRELTKSAGPDAHIREADYDALGGVVGALNRRADQLVEELTARGYGSSVMPALLKLVTVDQDEEPIRRRMPRKALTQSEQQVVDTFVEARLLVSNRRQDGGGDAIIEVAHEALLRQWPPLRQAIDDSRASIRLRAELEREAADWDRGGNENSYLLRGGRLLAIQEWVEHSHADLSPQEVAFLRASHELASREIEQVRRSNRRLRQLLAGAAVLLLIAVVSGVVALMSVNAAENQARIALTRQLITEAGARRASQPDLALLLNLEALHRAPADLEEDALLALRQTLNRPFHIARQQFTHLESANAIAFSADGTVLASGSSDKTVRLWDVATGEQKGEPLIGHTAGVHGVAFSPRESPDGPLLASASNDGTLRLWDAATGLPHGAPLTEQSTPVGDVAFSPDGSLVAATTRGGQLLVWDVATGSPRGQPLIDEGAELWRVVFHPDGSMLAVASADGSIRLCRIEPVGQCETALRGHTGWVNGLAFSPDGSRLATAGFDGTVRLWDVRAGAQLGDPLMNAPGELTDVTFSPDGLILASGGRNSEIRLWDALSRNQLGEPLSGHANAVRDLVFSPDSKHLASASYDGTVRLWDVEVTVPGGTPIPQHAREINDLAIAANGTLATAGADGTVRIWDLASREERGGGLATDSHSWVSSVAFNEDGTLVATASADHLVRIWDAATGQQRGQPLSGHTDEVSSVAFSPDGVTLASAGRDGTIRLWNITTGTEHIMTGHRGKVLDIAYRPGSTTLASVGEDGTVRLWDTETFEQQGEAMEGHPGWVLTVAFSKDGVVASGGGDGTVRLWTAENEEWVGQQLTGHSDEVTGLAFRPDGRVLTSVSKDGTQRFWNVDTNRPIGEPLVGQTVVRHLSVAYSPDGALVISGSGNGSVHITDLDPEQSEVEACTIASRNLTESEWSKFVGESEPYVMTCPANG
ncbi:MAG: TIR domain-containing protein [Microbacterium sp.]